VTQERPGRRAICPIIVGRDDELALLGDVLDAAAHGLGSTVVLSGEAGVGKTRLAREALNWAAARSMTTLVGRGVQHGLSPYRPLSEALFPVARRGGLPDAPDLNPFRHALGAIVPDWRAGDGGVQDSPVIVGEGVLRLTRHTGGGAGTLVVIEDVHWADPDTLAVLEYLADNVASEPTVVLLTIRSGEPGPANDLVTRLELRGAARVVTLGRLGPSNVAAMAAACGAKGLDENVIDAVARRSDGLPLLVEELLSVPVSGISDAVPDSFAEAVSRRLLALPAESVLVIQCAAVLGRHFDWRRLPAVTGLGEARVGRGLEAGVAVQLLAADDGRFRFRHALTRDAVVRALLPPVRVSLARRAAQAVADQGLGDDAAAKAAELWVAAGDEREATVHLLAAGQRAVSRGALVTAERLLDRARQLRPEDDDVRTEVAEALAEALALAAKLERALEVGTEALRLLDSSERTASRRARLHLALARAADGATKWALAGEHLDEARRLGRAAGDDVLLARVEALAAHVAMGELRYHDAEALAQGAFEEASRMKLSDAACEALEVLGRLERLRDLKRAAKFFEQAYDLARRDSLVLWSIRALHELGTIDMFERTSPDGLLQASELAYDAGALALAATVDLQLLGLYGFLFEIDRALEVGARVVDVARTLGLAEVHAAALLQLGFVNAIAGRGDALEAAVDAALRVSGEHPEALALAWGHARATYSLLTEDRSRAIEQLDIAMSWARKVPGMSGIFPALWALLRVVEGGGDEVIADVAGLETPAIPISGAIVSMAEAVVAGRAGQRNKAEARVEAADGVLRSKRVQGFRHLARRLVAEAAIEDGWGHPAGWLSEAMAFFEDSGHDRVAAACRDMLRRAGQRVPRSVSADLPRPLRAAGVTRREGDVLRLVGARLSNREIAERLYLSPRTVEKHVERLLQKTGATTRVELGRIARETFTTLPAGET